MNDFLDAARPSPFVEFISRRWVRITVIVWIVFTIGATITYQTFVAPTLTADRFELWLAGSPDRVGIDVDSDADVVHITGGQKGLTELFIVGDSMLVRATDIDATTDATWIRVPLTALDPAVRALEPERLPDALRRRLKECAPPTEDAAAIVDLVIARPPNAEPDWQVCGGAWNNAAPEGDILSTADEVSADEVATVPTAGVVELADLDDPDAVTTLLDGLIRA